MEKPSLTLAFDIQSPIRKDRRWGDSSGNGATEASVTGISGGNSLRVLTVLYEQALVCPWASGSPAVIQQTWCVRVRAWWGIPGTQHAGRDGRTF